MVSLRAVVHVGPMKTGTTAFAAACTQAERLGSMPAGMLYPTGALWFDEQRSVAKHHQLNAPARSKPAARRARAQTKASIDELAVAFSAVVVEARHRAVDGTAAIVMVAEGLSNHANPTALTAFLRDHVDRVDYVLVARQQSRAVGSMIAHGVKDVGAPDRRNLVATDFLAQRARARRFDYARILDSWRHEGSTLHVLPFDESAPGTSLLTDAIFDRVGLARLPASETLSARRAHPSFSAEGLRELAGIKRQYQYLGWLPNAEARYRAAFSAAWEVHHRAVRNGNVAPWRLSAEEERAVVATYAESNQRFRELLGPDAESLAWRDWFTAVGIDVDSSAEARGGA